MEKVENMEKVEKQPKNNRGLYILLGIISLALITVLGYLGYDFYLQKSVASINASLEKPIKTLSDCKAIIDFNEKGNTGNKYINTGKLTEEAHLCRKNYILKRDIFASEEAYCKEIIAHPNSELKKHYLAIDETQTTKDRTVCEKEFLQATFKVAKNGSVSNDFYTNIHMDLNFDIATNLQNLTPETKVKVKERILKKLDIEPKIKLDAKQVILDKKSLYLNLPLASKTKYKLKFKGKEVLKLTTPEFKYFGIRLKNPVSLYHKNNLPVFELLSYNTEKTQATVHICSLTPESYAEIEVFSNTKNRSAQKKFLSEKLQAGNYKNCEKKKITITESKDRLTKQSFSIDEFVKEKNGLYTVFLDYDENITIGNKLNLPIFFGIVNSHILMKISKKGEGFFFVHDFEGKPLANQEISVYLNNFEEFKNKYNRGTKKREKTYKLDGAISVFSKPIILGKTDKDGILKLDIQAKIKDVFEKTFRDEYTYDYTGLYNSFFVQAKGENTLSFLTSTWNAGIEPWNFGYSTWYMNNKSKFSNNFQLTYWKEIKDFNAHIFPDRKLYLPEETVHLKAVVRTASDLKVPTKDEKFTLIVRTPKGKELLNEEVNVNEFGSFTKELKLKKSAELGNYYVSVNDSKNRRIAYSSFSVEIFKNPKFKNEVSLETKGLNGEIVEITEEKEDKREWYYGKIYTGKFAITGFVKSKYYSGGQIKNSAFTYKVYKQYYYKDEYWDDCYYGCYWEPRKQFYTQGKGKIGEDGIGKFEIPVKFESTYNDYKYIVEVSVTDEAGDTITGANSIIAKLPDQYKRYNYQTHFALKPSSRFVKVGEKLEIVGGLNIGKWKEEYNNKYGLIIKRKNYANQKVTDVNGYKRNIVNTDEEIEDIVLVNDKNFTRNNAGKLVYNFIPKHNGEYIFEYGNIEKYRLSGYFSKEEKDISKEDIEKAVEKFKQNNGERFIFTEKEKHCKKQNKIVNECEEWGIKKVKVKFDLEDLISGDYFPVIAYDGKKAKNPIKNDNKLNVIAEKVSYKLGETAKILVRLPVSDAKILMTIEKNGVKKSEYITVTGNTFFKEIKVDESLVPNAYISVFMVDTENKVLPEYKVGYTEIVLDKTDKKAFIDIETDKKEYAPREEVTLNLGVKDKLGKAVKSELTVMVVDDALISLMGNINPNILEKIFKKLPFSIQTSMGNIAMIRNYYFSRRGLVGGSGFGNFKGGDSAVSTRNIFKNTAFYKADIVTDDSGKAQVKFNLPDNLTNFRVMVVSNAKDNHFGYEEQFIKVRKTVILEDKTPLILRSGDKAQIGTQLFNNTEKDMGFKTNLQIKGVAVKNPEKDITLKKGESQFVTWDIEIADKNLGEISYTISALGDSAKNSDKLENTIEIKQTPVLLNTIFKNYDVTSGKNINEVIKIPENTDFKHSKVKITVSNNQVVGIESIAKSLAKYPYGCIEQLASTTLPNVLLKKLTDIFPKLYSLEELDKNITHGLEKILALQNEDGGFAYWSGDSESNIHATPYVLRTLIYMKNRGEKISDSVIEKAANYLEQNYSKASEDEKGEIYFALKMAGRNPKIDFDYKKLNRHGLISFTYGLVLSEKQDKQLIENNIELIKKQLADTKENYYYWNPLGDKAIFTKLLLDYDYKKYATLTDSYIDELYNHNWSSYYYSTQTKNNAFMAFNKYLQLKKNTTNSKLNLKIGDKNLEANLSKENLVKTFELPLSELVSDNAKGIMLDFKNSNAHTLYVDVKLESYPEEVEKVKPYANGVNITETIYEVMDEAKLEKCRKKYYNKSIFNTSDCSQVLKKVEGNIFKKGKLYKSEIQVSFPEHKNSTNVTIEDYLPGTFRVINSKFKTESSSIRQVSKTWRWNHTELKPNVIMTNASYWYGKEQTFEFYFKPEFAGSFVNPPVITYEMYNPKVRAYNEYRVIEVK